MCQGGVIWFQKVVFGVRKEKWCLEGVIWCQKGVIGVRKVSYGVKEVSDGLGNCQIVSLIYQMVPGRCHVVSGKCQIGT